MPLCGLAPTDRRYERAVLDRDLARKEYESLRQKYSESESMVLEGGGWKVEDTPPPPESQSPSFFSLGGWPPGSPELFRGLAQRRNPRRARAGGGGGGGGRRFGGWGCPVKPRE